MEDLFIIVTVTGFVQLVKSLFDGDYRSAIIIAGSAVIGALAGFFQVHGLDVVTGIMAGLSASGLITLSKAAGGQRISSVQ